MRLNVYVGSKTQATVFMPIEGSGMTVIDAQRNAVNLARGLHRIPDPVVLSGNEACRRIYQQAHTQFASKTKATNMNGNDVPFWKRNDRWSLYYKH